MTATVNANNTNTVRWLVNTSYYPHNETCFMKITDEMLDDGNLYMDDYFANHIFFFLIHFWFGQ